MIEQATFVYALLISSEVLHVLPIFIIIIIIIIII
jgi:hypothetical protein